MKEIVLSIDKNIFFFFQEIQRPWLDPFLAWPTHLGSTWILLPLVVAGILIFDKNGMRKIPSVVLSIGGIQCVTPMLKAYFARPRPHVYWEDVAVIFSKPLNRAFPSGHTAVIFAGACALHYLYGKKMRWAYAVAVWVAMTRLYVGAHYTTDLVGGALVAAAWSFLVCSALKKLSSAPDIK